METTNTISKREVWRAYIDDWRASGLSQREWCRKNNQSVKKFGYWVRKFRREEASYQVLEERKENSSRNECYEISFPKEALTKDMPPDEQTRPGLAIQFKDYRLYINNGISENTLRIVMEVLADA